MPVQAEEQQPGVIHVNQIDLFSAIAKHITRRHGKLAIQQRHLNAIIAAANIVVDEFAHEAVMPHKGMTLTQWLASDDVGASSQYMAFVLGTGPLCERRHPLDPDDFGRCHRLLEAVEGLRERVPLMAVCGQSWKVLAEHWDELETLYREELPTGNAPRLYTRMQELFATIIKEQVS